MRYTYLIAILILASCSGEKKPEQKDGGSTASGSVVILSEEQKKNANLTIGRISIQDIKAVIKVSGKIDVPPQNMVSVSFPLGGYLKSTQLLPGMQIRKGEVIATMEDAQYIQLQQDYLTAKAKQDYIENEYQRQKELNASKATSDKIFQQAEADYKSNKILISGLKQKLQLIGINAEKLDEHSISRIVKVHAPIDGFVSAVNVNIGKYVTPSDVLFELVNPSDVHLALTIFEKDINSLYIGQKLVAYTNNDPDKKYPCEIILIGKDIGDERSIQVHCHFDKYDHSLVPGMYMNAVIEVNNVSSSVLPEDAIVRYGNKQYIFIAHPGNKYEMMEVQTGVSQNGLLAIVNADSLNLADQAIVTANAYTLLMKLKNAAE